MNANTRKLHDLGQRLWLDNIPRDLLDSSTLARYIADLSVTGLTSNRRSSSTPSAVARWPRPPRPGWRCMHRMNSCRP